MCNFCLSIRFIMPLERGNNSMAFIYYNPNPYNKLVGDCVIRAISKAFGIPWINAYTELCMYGMEKGDIPSSNSLWSSFLRENGYRVIPLSDSCPECYTVRDFCRGIPHGKKKLDNGEEKETVEVLCTKSNSGGKFDAESYITNIGLNGLGLTVTNALSEQFEIITYRDKKFVRLTAEHGIVKNIEYGKSKEQGTLVRFKPDNNVFQNSIIPIEYIKQRCCISTALGYKSLLFVDDVLVNTDSTMFDLMYEKDKEKDISVYIDYNCIDVHIPTKEYMKCAIRYTSETTDKYYGYTNLLYNSAGGTHIQELSKAIIECWKNFIKTKKIKLDVELKPSDYLLGVRAVCAVFIINKQFSSQTKEKLVVPKGYLKDLMDGFIASFTKELSRNEETSRALLNRFV